MELGVQRHRVLGADRRLSLINQLVKLTPFAAGLAVAVAFLGMSWIAGLHRPIGDPAKYAKTFEFLCKVPATPGETALEYAARIAWGGAAALVAVGALALAVVVTVIFVESDRATRWLALTCGGVLLIGTGLAIVAVQRNLGFRGFGGPLIDRMVHCAWTRGGLERVEFASTCLNGIAIVASIGAALAACATLRSVEARQPREALAEVAQRQRRLDVLLYAGAILLTAGALEVGALLAWTSAPFPGTAEAKVIADITKPPGSAVPDRGQTAAYVETRQAIDAIKRFSRAVAIVVGLGFTTLLIAIYLPAAVMLRARAALLSRRAIPSGTDVDRLNLLTEYGFGSDYGQRLLKLGASLAPVAMTALTMLLDLFGRASPAS